jgi:hypothetical protein
MTALGCEQVRDQLPDYVSGGKLAGVGEHLASCSDCRAEAGLLAALRNASPQAPPGLEARVLHATRARTVPRAWGSARQLAVAATLVGAVIGGSLLLQTVGSGDPRPTATGNGSAGESPEALLPVLEDPVLNGSSVLSNLTDAELESLLARMES